MDRKDAYARGWISTSRNRPQGSVGQALAIQAGLVHQTGAGLYSYLPLGKKILERIELVVREEMKRAQAVPFSTPILQPASIWQTTGRWDIYGEEMFKLENRQGQQFALGPTHEEIITALIADRISSYRQLPFVGYQITRKFRDELRPRGGLLRAREFEMLDAYSFDQNQEQGARTYQEMRAAYKRILDRLGLDYVEVEADSGEIGGDFSEMFLAKADSGDDAYVLENDKYREAGKDEEGAVKAIEIGHIFQLGEVYTKPLGATFSGKDNQTEVVYGGCYGIGISRLVSAVIEQNHDERGIIWPNEISPFDVIILPLNTTEDVVRETEALVEWLEKNHLEVLVDWRSEKPGAKFNDAALIGIPKSVTIGRGAKDGIVEIEDRKTGQKQEMDWHNRNIAAALKS